MAKEFNVKLENSFTPPKPILSMYPNHNIQSSTCVAACPKGFFGSQGLCLPEKEELRNQYLSNPSISSPFDYSNFKTALIWSALTALGLGLLWTVISFCFPKLAPTIAHILGALVLITLGILVLVLWDR